MGFWPHHPCSEPSKGGHTTCRRKPTPCLLTNLPLTTVCSPPPVPVHIHPLCFLPRPELSHLWVFAHARLSARNTPCRVFLESSGTASSRKPPQPSVWLGLPDSATSMSAPHCHRVSHSPLLWSFYPFAPPPPARLRCWSLCVLGLSSGLST